jgi:hypothetical protein
VDLAINVAEFDEDDVKTAVDWRQCIAVVASALVPGDGHDAYTVASAMFVDAMSSVAEQETDDQDAAGGDCNADPNDAVPRIDFKQVEDGLLALPDLDPELDSLVVESTIKHLEQAAKTNGGKVCGDDMGAAASSASRDRMDMGEASAPPSTGLGIDASLKRLRMKMSHDWAPPGMVTGVYGMPGDKDGRRFKTGPRAKASKFRIAPDLDLSYLKNIKARVDSGMKRPRRRPRGRVPEPHEPLVLNLANVAQDLKPAYNGSIAALATVIRCFANGPDQIHVDTMKQAFEDSDWTPEAVDLAVNVAEFDSDDVKSAVDWRQCIAVVASTLVPGDGHDAYIVASAMFVDAMSSVVKQETDDLDAAGGDSDADPNDAVPRVDFKQVEDGLLAIADLNPGMDYEAVKSTIKYLEQAAKTKGGKVCGGDMGAAASSSSRNRMKWGFGVDAPLKRLRMKMSHDWVPPGGHGMPGDKDGRRFKTGPRAKASKFRIAPDLDLSYLKKIKARVDSGMKRPRRRPRGWVPGPRSRLVLNQAAQADSKSEKPGYRRKSRVQIKKGRKASYAHIKSRFGSTAGAAKPIPPPKQIPKYSASPYGQRLSKPKVGGSGSRLSMAAGVAPQPTKATPVARPPEQLPTYKTAKYGRRVSKVGGGPQSTKKIPTTYKTPDYSKVRSSFAQAK